MTAKILHAAVKVQDEILIELDSRFRVKNGQLFEQVTTKDGILLKPYEEE